MSDKSNKSFYHQLNKFEQCLANRYSGAMANQHAQTTGYPYNQATFELHSQAFRDITLAMYGMHTIEDRIKASPSLVKGVRMPCLTILDNDPMSLLTSTIQVSKPVVER